MGGKQTITMERLTDWLKYRKKGDAATVNAVFT